MEQHPFVFVMCFALAVWCLVDAFRAETKRAAWSEAITAMVFVADMWALETHPGLPVVLCILVVFIPARFLRWRP